MRRFNLDYLLSSLWTESLVVRQPTCDTLAIKDNVLLLPVSQEERGHHNEESTLNISLRKKRKRFPSLGTFKEICVGSAFR